MNADESLAQAFSEELPWLAFLYVSEELTPDEVVDFEERLLTDQAAREAVAEAMKMAEGLWLATAVESLSIAEAPAQVGEAADVNRSRSRWAVWLGTTALAAGLAFGIGWWFAQMGDSPESAPPIAKKTQPELVPESPAPPGGFPMSLDAERLVGIWSDARTLLAELGSDSDGEFSPEEDSFREAPEPEEETFAWMLAAVSAGSPDNPEVNPDVMEN